MDSARFTTTALVAALAVAVVPAVATAVPDPLSGREKPTLRRSSDRKGSAKTAVHGAREQAEVAPNEVGERRDRLGGGAPPELGQTEPPEPVPSAPSAAELAIGIPDGSYILGPHDKIQVEVWNRAAVEFEWRALTITGEGTIYLPLIGEVRAAEKTVPELTQVLTRLYDAYIIDAKVYIEILEYNSRQVSLVGEVRGPGRYVLRGNVTLSELLAQAGDVTATASNRVRVVRETGGSQPTVFEIDLARAQQGDPEANILLEPKDVVHVLANPKVSVIGEIKNPGRHDLKGDMLLTELLASAGDLNENASNVVRVIRSTGSGDTQVMDIDLARINAGDATENIRIEPGDVVYVLTNKNIVYVSGEVSGEGYVDWEEGMTALQAVILAGGFAEGASQGRAKIYRNDGAGTLEIKVNLKDKKKQHQVQPGDIIHVPKSWF